MPELNAVGIVVRDMAETMRFYGLLGIELAGEGHVEATLANGLRLMLDGEDVVKSFDAGWARETGNQLSLAFECASAEEVDAVYARVVEGGFAGVKEPWDAVWGQRYAQLRDPNGVPVDLYAWTR